MNKKGFTLIELLAVIIILGVLMIIAIPSVSKYINDSRKNGYISTAKELVGGARTLIHSGSLNLDDFDTTYYIDAKCISTDNAYKSPYGDFVKAYVVVTAANNNYEYYWTSVDDAGIGVKGLINVNKLDLNNIETDITTEDISTQRTINGRNKVIQIKEDNNCQKGSAITENLIRVNELGESIEDSAVVYPTGKNRNTVIAGDLVTIGTEEFYVVKKQGNDLVLITRYNLKVGSIYDKRTWDKVGDYLESSPGYGIQSSEALGWNEQGHSTGTIAFAQEFYWDPKIGTDYPGIYCNSQTTIPSEGCAYVYDSNSSLYSHINNYKDYLEGFGATVKEARLLKVEEAIDLGCSMNSRNCNNSPNFIKATSYWLGSPISDSLIWLIVSNGQFGSTITSANKKTVGLRPVIVV